ncbi:MAG: RNA-binding cell elongation regulator Jag/EloR [Actinomycetes bacterium]
MEWVETTGSTTEEAKSAALDQLGVDEQDAEFEVIDEAKSGLFGLTRREARVRARVRPTNPRPKVERRDRRRKQTSSSTRGSKASGSNEKKSRQSAAGGDATTEDVAVSGDKPPAKKRSSSARKSSKPKVANPSTTAENQNQGTPMTSDDATVEEQAEIITDFMEGLLEAFSYDGDVTQDRIDDDTIELQVNGDDLGLLIGPKGQTLSAIQELSRTVVQRRASGSHHGRVRLDVSGYRLRRREALARFATQVAEEVRETGIQKALEPMNPADRKVVHDTVNEIDGVSTLSEGEDQRRRVVLIPQG